MKKIKIISYVLVAMLSLQVMIACKDDEKKGGSSIKYPDFKLTENTDDSWKLVDDDDEDIEIEWWLDSTSWDFYQLRDMIYEKTGVKVNFTKALNGDGTELTTKIVGDKLPDVFTITDFSTRKQLEEDGGYVYPINGLAERWAPSMLDRIPKEMHEYYKSSDGNFYGVPNNFYSDSDLAEYEAMGEKVVSNYSVVVRQDYLNAYIEYKKSQNANFDENSISNPNNFIDMCVWVKSNFNLGNDNPTVLLSPFASKASNGVINDSYSALMEFMNVPKEDKNGNLVYEYATDEYLEVLSFLNNMFREKLILSSNLGYTSSDIDGHIRNGRPFVVVGSVHNYSTAFASRSASGYNQEEKTFSESNEYVPIVLTNSKNEAPILFDISGRGLRVSMISTNCKRPDRVIKVFDYLLSEEGQRDAYYGKENEYHTVKVMPGEKDTNCNQTLTYGQVEWTKKAKDLLGATNGSGWYNAGIKQISLLTNPMYVALTSLNRAEMDTYHFYKRYEYKSPLNNYVHSRIPLKYNLVINDIDDYFDILEIQEDIESVWVRNLPSLLMAPNDSELERRYKTALQEAKNYGYEEWLEYQNISFLAYKEANGISFAYPKNDPSYVAPKVVFRGDTTSYYKSLPNYINIS